MLVKEKEREKVASPCISTSLGPIYKSYLDDFYTGMSFTKKRIQNITSNLWGALCACIIPTVNINVSYTAFLDHYEKNKLLVYDIKLQKYSSF